MKIIKMSRVITLFITTILASCGGGGGTTPAPTPTPTPTPFQSGVFASSTDFQASCQAPRSGTDPFTGSPYPDMLGSTLNENQWLRSWSNELYLWYSEINDQNPVLYNDPEVYFDTLKTLATTPSGADRDNFHFSVDTAIWDQLSQSGLTSGYGANFVVIEGFPPRNIIVSFVEPSSPAANAGLRRGSKVLTIDGVDAVNNNTSSGVDTLNAGLSPAADGETHSFTFRHLGDSNDSSFSLTSEEIIISPVLETSVIDNGPGSNVGYLVFNDQIATAEAQLITSVETLINGNITDLVLDLRYNGGGYLAIASQLAYMIAGPAVTENKVFELQEFNDKGSSINPVTGQAIIPMPFIDQTIGFSVTSGQPLPSLGLNRVFVITGEGTCSASEAIMNGLRGINVEVIQIGSTTCGKPYGFYPQDNCGTTYFSIQFKGTNDIGFGDYSDGFSPQNTLGFMGEPVTGCSVADDFSAALGDPVEARLAAALQYLNTSSCPSPAAAVSSLPTGGVSVLGNPFGEGLVDTVSVSLAESLLRQNRILGMP